MATIDADAHVIESDQTWIYLKDNERKYIPSVVRQISGTEKSANRGNAANKEYWLFNSQIQAKDKNIDTDDTTAELRELSNIAARLKHMTELNIDVQVLYPTIFLIPGTKDAEAELALHRCYNRWLANIWKGSNNRLRWAAMAPLYSMDKVREEMEFAKANGACAIFVRALECDRQLSESYFHPLYKIAEDLDMAIALHAGNGSFQNFNFYAGYNFANFKLTTVAAFHDLLDREIPKRFPKVRWGFIEAGASWIPYALSDLKKRYQRRGSRLSDNPLKDNNVYVTCEVSDDIPYIIQQAGGDDNLVIGTDYGHTDTAAQIQGLRAIRENGTVNSQSVDKILGPNAQALYGLR